MITDIGKGVKLMHSLISKVVNMFSILGANGAGSSVGGSPSTAESGSAISSFFAKVAQILSDFVLIIYGWIMSVLWYVVRLVLNLIDVLQYFVEKLVGIDVFKEKGWSKLTSVQDSDLIVKLLLNKTVLKVFFSILILSGILLVIFTIFSLIKSNYEAATTDGEMKTKPADVFKRVGKALFLVLIIPTMVIVGVLGSNVVLASICNAIRGNNDLTLGGVIFNASSYNANKYRIYANAGVRTPMISKNASEVILPKEYVAEDDMQVLFYKLVKGDVYIAYVCDNEDTSAQSLGWFKDMKEKTAEQGGFSRWTSQVDINSARKTSASGQYVAEFVEDFQIFYKKYCDGKPLEQLSNTHKLIKSIYETNWTVNDSKYKSSYSFPTTYEIAKENIYFTPTGAMVNIYQNTDIYSQHESFATLELEYYVMADLIDYAIKHNNTFYYVNANNKNIRWSDIPVNDGKDSVNITSFNNEFNVLYSEADKMYYTYYGKITTDTNKGVYCVQNGVENKYYIKNAADGGADQPVMLLSDSSFYVAYYNGTNRLYWSSTNSTNEDTGATFIICTKLSDGTYIPVTQKTTNFHSSFLSEDYDGPIVARGIFTGQTSVSSNSELYPCAIREQKVDEYGNELSSNTYSDYSLSDDGYLNNAYSGLYDFVGQFSNMVAAANLFFSNQYANMTNLYNDFIDGGINNAMENFMAGVYLADSAGNAKTLNNFYINPNIAYYSLSSDNKYIYFYDKEYKQIGYKNGDDFNYDIRVEQDGIQEINAYYIFDNDGGINWLISYDELQSSAIENILTKLMGKESDLGRRMTYDDSLIIRFTGKMVDFYRDGNNKETIIVGMKASGLSQGGSDFKTSGQFEVYDYVKTISSPTGILANIDVYTSRVENLIIKNGEVYTASGFKLIGQSDLRKLYASALNKAVRIMLKPENILYLTAAAVRSCESAIEDAELLYEDARNYVDMSDVYKNAPIGKALGSKVVQDVLAAEIAGVTTISELSNRIRKNSALLFKMLGSAIGSDLIIGVGAVQEMADAYYSIKPDEQDENKGIINYYNNTYTNTGVGTSSRGYSVAGQDSVLVSKPGKISLDVVMSREKLTKVDFVSVGELSSLYYQNNNRENIYNYTLNYTLNYSKYGDNYLGAYITDLSLSHGDQEVGAQWLVVRNGGVYCRSLGKYVLTADTLKDYIVENAIASEKNKLKEAFTLKNISEFNSFYTYFYSGAYNDAFLLDGTLKLGLDVSLIFRLKAGLGYNYSEKVVYRLENGGFKLDYNFIKSTGIGMTNLFLDSKINPLVLIFATAIVFNMLKTMVWGLISRIYRIAILFIVMPATVSTNVFDEGARFGKWKDNMIEQVFIAYTVLIMLNLYFALIPTVEDITRGLITWDELPSTFTGLFSCIGVGFKSAISAVAGGIKSVISSIGGGNMSLVGALSIKSTGLPILLAETTNATVVASDLLNLYIYILFFLVLTTLAKNGSDILGKLVDPGGAGDVLDQSDKAIKGKKEVIDKAKNGPLVKATEFAVDAAKKVGGFTSDAVKWVKGLLGDSRPSTELASMMPSQAPDIETGSAPYTTADYLAGNPFDLRPNININELASDPTTEEVYETNRTYNFVGSSGGGGGDRPIGFGSTVGGGSNPSGESGKEKTVIHNTTTTVVEEVSNKGGGGSGSYFNAGGGGSGEGPDDLIGGTNKEEKISDKIDINTKFKIDGSQETTDKIQDEMIKAANEFDRCKAKIKENEEFIKTAKNEQKELQNKKDSVINSANEEILKMVDGKIQLSDKEKTDSKDIAQVVLDKIYEQKRNNDEKVVSNKDLADLEVQIKTIKGNRDSEVSGIDANIKQSRVDARSFENDNNILNSKAEKLEAAYNTLDKLDAENKNYNPIDAVMEEVAKKADKTEVAEIDAKKADKADVEGKADKAEVLKKADKAEVANKADKTEVATKADADKTAAAINTKADADRTTGAINDVASHVNKAADASSVRDAIKAATDEAKEYANTVAGAKSKKTKK